MFIPIDREEIEYPKLYTKIINNIKELILNGELKAGDKLPSERELAEMFQVSRVPVREALKILEYIGVVKNINGQGMHVQSIDIEDLIDTINFALLTPEDSISDLFEVREATETQAAYLAAARRTESDLAAMEKALNDMETEIQAGGDGSKPSLEFHAAIVRASKNKMLYQINIFFMDLLQLSRKKTLKSKEHRLESLRYHKMILEKIKEQDASASANLMMEHLKVGERFI